MITSEYYSGPDLGQKKNYTAIAVVGPDGLWGETKVWWTLKRAC